jgi:outer membrane protein
MRQQEALALNREREEFLHRRTRAMNEKMMQRMREILEEIRKMVEEQGRTDDYDFVFDRTGLSTSQVPLLVYSKDAVDLTGKLLDRMNRARPSDGGEANGAGNGAGGVLSE